MNLSIRPGETIALVGPSGGGKSTTCSLLPRFYDVASGSIRIDGQDVRDVTQESLRRAIGLVQQDVYLFDGTLRDNIAYGRPGASDAEIEDAARKANIHDFIASLPEGYDTVVGERGSRLSGGQKAARGHRPRVPQRPGDPHPGRGDLGPRQRERGGRAGVA